MVKRFIVSVLAVCLSVLGFVSCGKNDRVTDPEPDTLMSVVNDYETNAEFDTMYMRNFFGRIEINTDAKYVQSGNRSMKLIMSESSGGNIYQMLEQKRLGKDITDFSKVRAVTLDVYNDSDEIKSFSMQLVYGKTDGPGTYFRLTPGWNRIKYTIHREFIPEIEELGHNIRKVAQIVFSFTRVKDGEEVFYIDNCRVYRTEETAESEIDMTLRENEICSFDREWQSIFAQTDSVNYVYFTVPTLQQSKDYGRTSCKITAVGYGSKEWGLMALNADMCKNVPWASYPDNALLEMDFFVPIERGIIPTVYIIGKNDKGEKKTLLERQLKDIAIGEWYTFSISVADINNNWQAKQNGVTFAQTAYVQVGWQDSAEGEIRTLYLDDVRMRIPVETQNS